MYKQIKGEYEYEFEVEKDGMYAIVIKASCKGGKLFGLFGGEDLRVELDGIKFREVPAKDNRQYYNIPPAWNGAKLKGLSKTVIFILELKAGKHSIKFIPKLGAVIAEAPKISEIKNLDNIKLDLQEQAEDGDRRPWITMALVDLPLRILDACVKCDKRKWDSDNIRLIIDGQKQKNEFNNWWGRDWFWQGRFLKGDAEERRFYFDLERGNHYIEFWADRMPILNELWLYLGIESDSKRQDGEKQAQPKTSDYIIELVSELYREIGKEVKFEKVPAPIKNFTKFDKEIEIAAKEFDVDPFILKATIAQESGFGNKIDHDERYIGESGLAGLEVSQSINTLKRLGYDFNYYNIGDVIRASAAYYDWVRERPTTFDFKDKNNPLKLYTQYRSDLRAEGIYPTGIPQFLYYYFFYKE